MYYSLYAYPWDVQDETPRAFCVTAKEQIGVDTISLAVSYHAGKLLLPHNPRRKVYYPEDGALFFRPDQAAFANSAIQPYVSGLAQEEDILASLCTEAEKHGLGVIAWVVCLHNTRLGMAYPEYTPRNAFGDAAISYLCPSHQAVRSYICALASDLAQRYPLRAIQLEAAHHMPFIHGFHHEMQQVPVTSALQVLLGLCFCSACLDQARESGIDGERVRSYVAREIEQQLQSGEDQTGEEAWKQDYWQEFLDGELGRYFAQRNESVSRLFHQVHQAVHTVSNTPVHLQDPSAIGVQRLSAPDLAWLSGLEIPPRIGMADGVTVPCYVADEAHFQRQIDLYCAKILPHMPLEIGLRPALPDCQSREDLVAKVVYCMQQKVSGISFYNYGMLPASHLQWIRDALSEAIHL